MTVTLPGSIMRKLTYLSYQPTPTDWPAGTLSFYEVFSDTMTHLHTFQATFTEPLYPAFGVMDSLMDSSVSLAVTSSPVPAENPA